MTSAYLTITPHDPIIARDARPFGAGIRMKSLDWLYPSVLAGSLRTMLGKMNGSDFNDTKVTDALKCVSVAGPLPVWKNTLFFPAPKDCLVKEQEKKPRITYAIRPIGMRAGECCDLPHKSLLPALLPDSVKDEFKPAKIAPLWSINLMTGWLANPDGRGFNAPPPPEKDDTLTDALNLPGKESRFHIKIDPRTSASEEGKLFETIGLDLSLKREKEGIQLAVNVEAEKELGDSLSGIDHFAAMGGERRLSYWKTAVKAHHGWSCPQEITNALSGKTKIRMVLATPAIFTGGWLPGWLKETGKSLEGSPPGSPKGLNLKLVTSCTEHWKPLSGFSLEKGNLGPKPLRRLVPAGSVYFFEIDNGDAVNLAQNFWLKPVSDDEQDRRDGFGLALWGVWDNVKEELK